MLMCLQSLGSEGARRGGKLCSEVPAEQQEDRPYCACWCSPCVCTLCTQALREALTLEIGELQTSVESLEAQLQQVRRDLKRSGRDLKQVCLDCSRCAI